MIERDGDQYDLECDHCSHMETITADTWGEMITESRERGWIHRKRPKGDWINLCPTCGPKTVI
jgi:hypothetical protein